MIETITTVETEIKTKGTSNGLRHHKIADLIYHEGPLLSLMCDSSGNTFLYKWVACNDSSNLWLVLNVTSEKLTNFFNKEISLRSLCSESFGNIVIEINDELEINLEKIIGYDKVPQSYLPKEASYYDENIYTETSVSLRNIWTYNLIKPNDKKIDMREYVKHILPYTELELVMEVIE